MIGTGAAEDDVSFGDLLRGHRVRVGLSQEELAERAGLSAKAIGALERGRRRAPYRDTVSVLGEALALDEPSVADLEATAARARMRSGVAKLEPLPGRRDNLPARITSFVGRRRELDDLGRLLRTHRLLTVTGGGGFGKTRLALESASRSRDDYEDGVWLVELASVSDEASVLAKIAGVLGVVPAAHDPVNAMVEKLSARNLLLVLDNCEHVLRHVVDLAAALLRGCPRIHLLATSRERLALSGEVTYRIPSLSVPDASSNLDADDAMSHAAVRLFAERAAMADPHFLLSDARVAAVVGICRKLEGIPLALEIAAARLPVFGLLSLRRKLDDRLNPLTSAFVDSPSRHRTLRATLEWSYDLLDGPERTLFRRLSIFARGCTTAAAQEVCAGGEVAAEAVPAMLFSLTDKSLLTVEDGEEGVRYAFLESTREFASEKMRVASEEIPLTRRFVEWAATYADAMRNDRYRVSEADWHVRAAAEFDNANAALFAALDDEDDPAFAGRILGGLRVHWHNSGRGAEALHLATVILAKIDARRNPSVAADLYLAKANILTGQERLEAVRTARELLTRARDTLGLMHCYMHLTWAYLVVGSPAKASHALGYAWTFAVLAGVDESHVRAPILYFRGSILERQGDISRARDAFAQGAEAAKTCGEDVTEARMRASCAEMYFCGGDVRQALARFEELIDNESWYRALQVYLQLRIAACLIFLDDLPAAEESARFALGAADRFAPFIIEAIQHLAHLASLRGDPVRAARLLGHNDRRMRDDGMKRDAIEETCRAALVRSLESQLDPVRIEDYRMQGESLTLEEAAEQALSSV